MARTPQPISGFPEWLPAVRLTELRWLDAIRATFERYGYTSIETPAVEELDTLLDEIVERDFPFFGACYGVGTLGVQQGGVVDRTYAEPVSCVPISLTLTKSQPVL